MSNLGLVISRLIIIASNKDINTCIEIKLAVEIDLSPVNFIITTRFYRDQIINILLCSSKNKFLSIHSL